MIPKLSNSQAWEQAQLLMQPAYIRVVDNLRKALEDSAWRESYQEVETPIPGYELCLSKQGQDIKVSLWELCFEVCFQDYQRGSVPPDSELQVDIDTGLFDTETGEVDWEKLDQKAQAKIENLFSSLEK
ncbi:hypothetical protein FRE64_08895 [Euhalothece natronophila Z-M001]|uniref:Uncharacterized protein n=1 Tax=Euhalothece natronophila Z-M001 TaxID=522448 RepID=A0A5B8NLX4_9CHRO|nr:hypothetical protein [Euhalothece natronophila]QDZ40044.1 hypothetical protein FRE64_08895 [Euhalothece natronophila Z-M001]